MCLRAIFPAKFPTGRRIQNPGPGLVRKDSKHGLFNPNPSKFQNSQSLRKSAIRNEKQKGQKEDSEHGDMVADSGFQALIVSGFWAF